MPILVLGRHFYTFPLHILTVSSFDTLIIERGGGIIAIPTVMLTGMRSTPDHSAFKARKLIDPDHFRERDPSRLSFLVFVNQ